MKDIKIPLIGLCGRSGSGKGYVAAKFAPYGIPSVDTDAVYRTLTAPSDAYSPCMCALVDAFGEKIALPDRSLNRRALAEIVFAEDGATSLKLLNKITHTHILCEAVRVAQSLADNGARAVIIDAPALYESGFDAQCACTVCVIAPDDVAVSRIVERDGICEAAARKRLDTQICAEELMQRCDYTIENGYGCATLDAQVELVAQDILARFAAQEGTDA